MTGDALKELKLALTATALYYGQTIPDVALRLYAEDLADLDLEECLRALRLYRRDRRNRKAPLPADIRAMIEGDQSTEGRAREIAARLHGALVRYGANWESGYRSCGMQLYDGGGRPWSSWRAAAVAELGGEDALRVLDRLGGWTAYFQFANWAEPTQVAAQIRGLAEAVGRLPRNQHHPALPSGDAVPTPIAARNPGDLVNGLASRMGVPDAPDGSGQSE